MHRLQFHVFFSFLNILIFVISLTLIQVNIVHGIRAPTPISVNKCCRVGERLDEKHQCVIGGTDQWWPLIFMILKQTYFKPQGDAPRFFKIVERSHPFCDTPEFYMGTDKMALFSNGSLYLSEKHQFLEPQNFCIDKNAAILCHPQLNRADSLIAAKKSVKIRKCCGVNAAYNKSSNTCVSLNGSAVGETLLANSTIVEFVYGFPNCKISNYFTIAERFSDSNFKLSTGRLTLGSGRQFEWNEYCLEHTLVDASKSSFSSYVNVFTCAEHLSAATTTNTPLETATDIRFFLFPIGLLISVAFLVATLATGFLLHSNHHVLHWRCQTFYIVCLLVGDLLLAFTQLFGTTIKGYTCISIAVCMHFFFLSAFFWLNTMCFNIWWTFRDFRPISMERSQEMVRLRIYKVYAWGVPLLITGTALTLDHMRKSSFNENALFLQPRFCEKEYWFAGNLEKLAYFYGPIGILLCVNLLLFASTARQLTCGLWKREEVKSTTERAALGRVCMKLVVVMGVTWIADILSWAHSAWFGGPYYIWIVTDLINALQGVFIFAVVGCHPQVSTAIKQIWSSKSIRFTSANTNTGQRNSNSSQVAASMGESMTNNTFTNSNTVNTKIPMETLC